VIRRRFVVAVAVAVVAAVVVVVVVVAVGVDVFALVAFVLGTWLFVLGLGLVGGLPCQGVVGLAGLVLMLIGKVDRGVVGVEEAVGRWLETRDGIGRVNVGRRVVMEDEMGRGVGDEPGIVDFDFVVGIEDLDSVDIEDSESVGIGDSEAGIGNVDFEGRIVGSVVVDVEWDGY
jgi:hypothetical protein